MASTILWFILSYLWIGLAVVYLGSRNRCDSTSLGTCWFILLTWPLIFMIVGVDIALRLPQTVAEKGVKR